MKQNEWPCVLRPGVCETEEQLPEMLSPQGHTDASRKELIQRMVIIQFGHWEKW